jgi:hypothetical protein
MIGTFHVQYRIMIFQSYEVTEISSCRK